MKVDIERIRQNAAKAATEDLLDRMTVFRAGMEPQALELIEAELTRRGVSQEKIDEYDRLRRSQRLIGDEVPRMCSFCDRPTVIRAWGLSHGRSLLPIWPWRFNYCEQHHQSRWRLFAR